MVPSVVGPSHHVRALSNWLLSGHSGLRKPCAWQTYGFASQIDGCYHETTRGQTTVRAESIGNVATDGNRVGNDDAGPER
jgi:hypothetical protein